MNNQELIHQITELTDEWYTLIGPDHHKDRDCHWHIETVWSYGRDPVYTVHHYGYILDKIEEECISYDVALQRLKEILIEEIEKYEKDQKENDPENDW